MTRSIALAAAITGLTLGAAVAQQESTNQLWVGSAPIDVARIIPGIDSMSQTITRDGEKSAGPVRVEEIAFETKDGKQLVRHTTTTSGEWGFMADTAYYDALTLAPVRHRSVTSRQSYDLRFCGNQMGGTTQKAGEPAEDVRATLDQPAYDPSSTVLLARALPLREGYRARIPVFNHETGSTRYVNVEVTGSETMRTDASTEAPVWMVSMSYEGGDGSQNYWITQSSRTVVKYEATWGNTTVRGWSKFTPATDET